MFGFLNPSVHSDAYRAVYSRCCQHQRLHHGILSLPFLSYEAIFLYLYWLDATGLSALELPQQRCCRFRSLTEVESIEDAAIGRFCSAAGMLLAGTKLEDDARDGISLRMRLAKYMLSDQCQAGRQYFRDLDPGFDGKLEAQIHAHLRMEKSAEYIPLEEYVQPTAEAFSYVFGILSQLPGLAGHRQSLEEAGRHVGAALIAFDCAVDWRRDRMNGEFNPLRDQEAVQSAMAYTKMRLRLAQSECIRRFHDKSATVELIAGVLDAIDFIPGDKCAVTPKLFLQQVRNALVAGAGTAVALAQNGQNSAKNNDGCGTCCCVVLGIGAAAVCFGSVTAGRVTQKKDCQGNPTYEVQRPCCGCGCG